MLGLIQNALQYDIKQFVYRVQKLIVVFDLEVVMAFARAPLLVKFLQDFFYLDRAGHEIPGNVVYFFIRACQQVVVHGLVDGFYVLFYQCHVVTKKVAAGFGVAHGAIS